MGGLAGLFFTKRDSADFSNPKNVLPIAAPSFLALLLPLVMAIIFMFIKFSVALLLSFFAYFIIAFLVSFPLRKNVLCKYCKQGELGCPAYEGMIGKK